MQTAETIQAVPAGTVTQKNAWAMAQVIQKEFNGSVGFAELEGLFAPEFKAEVEARVDAAIAAGFVFSEGGKLTVLMPGKCKGCGCTTDLLRVAQGKCRTCIEKERLEATDPLIVQMKKDAEAYRKDSERFIRQKSAGTFSFRGKM